MNRGRKSSGSSASSAGSAFENEIGEFLKSIGFTHKETYQKNEDVNQQFQDFLSGCRQDGMPCFIYQYQPICIGIYRKKKRCDLLLFEPNNFPNGLAIEAKSQTRAGSVDEKFPYLVENIKLYPCPTIIVMEGGGASSGSTDWLVNQAGQANNLLAVFPTLQEFEDWAQENLG